MMYLGKNLFTKHTLSLLSLMPALALATPALAWTSSDSRPPTLADTNEPGSVIVWPKFQTGTVPVNAGTPDAFNAVMSLIELGAVCPRRHAFTRLRG